jgi:hypothetical protein
MGPVGRNDVIRDLRELWNAAALVTGNFVLIGLIISAFTLWLWPS